MKTLVIYQKLINEIKSVESRTLSSVKLEKVIKEIDALSQGTTISKEPKIDLTVSDTIDKGKRKVTSADKRYFI